MKLFFLLLSVLLLTGCGSDKPAGLLPPEKMQRVQWDLMQADEMIEFYRTTDSTYPAERKRKELYSEILRLHGISQQQLDKSLDYYTAHPVQLKKILDSIQAGGEKLQQQKSDTAPTKIVEIDSVVKAPLRPDSMKRTKLFRRKAD